MKLINEDLNNEIVFEVIGHSTAVLCGVADDFVFGRHNFYIRTVVERIYHHVGMLRLRKSDAEDGGTLCRSNLGCNVMIGQIHFIVIGLSCFCFVREPRCPLILIEQRLARNRHDCKLAIVVNPRTWLVCLFETPYFVGRINVCPSVSHRACLPGTIQRRQDHQPSYKDAIQMWFHLYRRIN